MEREIERYGLVSQCKKKKKKDSISCKFILCFFFSALQSSFFSRHSNLVHNWSSKPLNWAHTFNAVRALPQYYLKKRGPPSSETQKRAGINLIKTVSLLDPSRENISVSCLIIILCKAFKHLKTESTENKRPWETWRATEHIHTATNVLWHHSLSEKLSLKYNVILRCTSHINVNVSDKKKLIFLLPHCSIATDMLM